MGISHPFPPQADVSAADAREKADAKAPLPDGDAQCPQCGGWQTEAEPIGGGNVHANKVEIWGSKDAPDNVYRAYCRDCKHAWRFED